MRRSALGIRERFAAKTIPGSGGCILWTAAKFKNGYGAFGLVDRRIEYAHRVGWALAGGFIPPKIDVCHVCDVRHCVNAEHLFLGTRSDNMIDCAKKGRTTSALSSTDVADIRRACVRGHDQLMLAKIFQVDPTVITNIKLGKSHVHV